MRVCRAIAVALVSSIFADALLVRRMTHMSPATLKRHRLSALLVRMAKDEILQFYSASLAAERRNLLEQGMSQDETPAGPFGDVESAFLLMPPYVDHAPREINVEGTKNVVKTHAFLSSSQCLVYAAGIATDSNFEEGMANSGCEVHAFDCTLKPSAASVVGKHFHFHDWCVGKGNADGLKSTVYNNADPLHNYTFKTLVSIMEELGHSSVDLLKFDIEGFEWGLFQDAILVAPKEKLPVQISFELHTSGANPEAVPPENVQDKHKQQVDELFLTLYDKGYRVVSKEINPFDSKCAEFIVINVDLLKM